MRRSVPIVAFLMLGVTVVTCVLIANGSGGDATITFVSTVSEGEINVCEFRVSNLCTTTLSGSYRVERKLGEMWVPQVDMLSGPEVQPATRRLSLDAGQSGDIYVAWREDLAHWRVQASLIRQFTRFELWRFQLARRLPKNSQFARWLQPRFERIVVTGPEMRMQRPAQMGKGTSA